jgi:hypothetical protein
MTLPRKVQEKLARNERRDGVPATDVFKLSAIFLPGVVEIGPVLGAQLPCLDEPGSSGAQARTTRITEANATRRTGCWSGRSLTSTLLITRR